MDLISCSLYQHNKCVILIYFTNCIIITVAKQRNVNFSQLLLVNELLFFNIMVLLNDNITCLKLLFLQAKKVWICHQLVKNGE